MPELEHIERHLAKGLVREYILRRCSKQILEELCHRRNLTVLPTGKRSSNRTVRNDYIRALLQYTRGKGAAVEDRYPEAVFTGVDLGINTDSLEMEMEADSAERNNMEVGVSSAETEANDMEVEVTGVGMEVDKVDNVEVNSGGAGIVPGTQEPPCRSHRDGGAELVRIRIFRGAKDWEPIDEIELGLESCGGLNLALLRKQLGGQVRIISPRTYRPFYEYTEGFLDGEDLQELLQDSYLRVVMPE